MRRSGSSWLALLIGLAIGVALGLIYAWRISPVIVTNTAPWQLSGQGQQPYLIAVSLAYAKDHDLVRAVSRLEDLRLGGDTWRVMADLSCDLARSSYASTNTGLTAIRSLAEIARSQGVTGCADQLLALNVTTTPPPTPTFIRPTPSLVPPPTKTPPPTLGPTFTPATPVFNDQTLTPTGDFKLTAIEAYCSPKTPGMIDVLVQDSDGSGLPGVEVEVDSLGNKDNFFTGLKPERDAGFADFQMSSGESYVVTLPGLGERSRPIEAAPCNVTASDGGGKSVTSYRVYFRRQVSDK